MHKAGLLVWALLSAGLMAIGAFSPWMTALNVISVTGWDVQKREAGALVLIAVVGAAAVFVRREASGGAWAIVAGLVGLLITGYEHHHITSAISNVAPQYQSLAHALVHVGWGLDLSLVASASLLLAGIASFFAAPAVERAVATTTTRLDPNTPTVPAGWYRDPNDDTMLRYWNGYGWTVQTAKPAS